jgi:starch phosphorylase
LWDAHQELKRELIDEIEERSGTRLAADRLLIGFARRAATYKRANLIFGNRGRLGRILRKHNVQLAFSGKAHPADDAGKKMVERLVAASRRWPEQVVFLEKYDMTLGALLTRGCDVWLNNPRRPMEASGTSGMKAAMNGVLNLSILDGWWPEGCRHGETGWRFPREPSNPDAIGEAAADRLDREALYDVLEDEVIPTYYDDHDRWVRMMAASIEMSHSRFSARRMVQDYCRLLYERDATAD